MILYLVTTTATNTAITFTYWCVYPSPHLRDFEVVRPGHCLLLAGRTLRRTNNFRHTIPRYAHLLRSLVRHRTLHYYTTTTGAWAGWCVLRPLHWCSSCDPHLTCPAARTLVAFATKRGWLVGCRCRAGTVPRPAPLINAATPFPLSLRLLHACGLRAPHLFLWFWFFYTRTHHTAVH